LTRGVVPVGFVHAGSTQEATVQYPLDLSFKALAFGPQVSVKDATGQLVFYVKQKAFKLKEDVTVFADEQQTLPQFRIKADRVLDFNARYDITDPGGASVGAVRRQGMKSLWRSRYQVLDGETPVMNIAEENPWVKVIDSVLEAIPVVGLFTGYVFHPRYAVSRPDGSVVMRVEKKPAFLEGKFRVEKTLPLSDVEERRALLSLLMMVLLERARG
jgi:uncharacterized protein YxjI